MAGATTTILFLGWRDVCRSRMAVALAPTLLGDGIRAVSAGLSPAEARDCTGTVLTELGLTAEEGPGRSLHDLAADGFDLVVTLDRRAQEARLRAEMSAPPGAFKRPYIYHSKSSLYGILCGY